MVERVAHEHVSLTKQSYDHVPRELLRHLHGTRGTRLRVPCQDKLAPRLMLSAGSGGGTAANGVGSEEVDKVARKHREFKSSVGAACPCALAHQMHYGGRFSWMFSQEMRATILHKCSKPGDYYHRRSWSGHEGANKAEWVSIIFSASPITLASRKWQFRAVLMCMFVVLIALLVRPEYGLVSEFMSENRATARHFRFAATELRAGKEAHVSEVAVGGLSLMNNGCSVPAPQTVVSRDGASLYLTSRDATQISANGFAFRTASALHDPAHDPVGFEFSFCFDLSAKTPADCPQQSWRVMGSAECLFTLHSLQCFPVRGRTFATSQDRNVEHRFDLRAPPMQSFCVIGRLCFEALGFLSQVVLGYFMSPHCTRIISGLIVFFLNGLINGVLYGVVNIFNFYGTVQAWTSVYSISGGLAVGMGWGIFVLFYEHRIFSRVNGVPSLMEISLGVFIFVVVPLDGLLIYGGGQSGDWWLFTLQRGAWIEIMLILAFYILITMFRSHVWREALASVRSDMDQYELEWRSIIMESSSQEPLLKLAELTQHFERGNSHKSPSGPTAVQRLRNGQPPVSVTPLRRGAPAFHRQNDEVTCLDQLYLQAHLIWPICVELVHGWAQMSGGHLMTDSTSTLQASTKGILSHASASACAGKTAAPGWLSSSLAATEEGDDVVIGKRRWDGFLSLVAVDPSQGWSGWGICSWNGVKVNGERTRVKWAAIKNPTRSIEKLQRVYNRHVCRLVDVVRQSIVFHDLSELTACLEAILQDPKVSFSHWPRHRRRGTLMHCRSHLVAGDLESPCLSPPARASC